MPQPYATHEKDPRRWVRRHHYQEGPGFLFLATQGGRPERDSLRPSPLARVRLPMRAIRLSRDVGVGTASRQLGCGRSALYEWLAGGRGNRWLAGGLATT